jgi:hypothetical protein
MGKFGKFNLASLFSDFIHSGAEGFKKTATHLPDPLVDALIWSFEQACNKKDSNKRLKQDK